VWSIPAYSFKITAEGPSAELKPAAVSVVIDLRIGQIRSLRPRLGGSPADLDHHRESEA
jgi:hypothetical protein